VEKILTRRKDYFHFFGIFQNQINLHLLKYHRLIEQIVSGTEIAQDQMGILQLDIASPLAGEGRVRGIGIKVSLFKF